MVAEPEPDSKCTFATIAPAGVLQVKSSLACALAAMDARERSERRSIFIRCFLSKVADTSPSAPSRKINWFYLAIRIINEHEAQFCPARGLFRSSPVPELHEGGHSPAPHPIGAISEDRQARRGGGSDSVRSRPHFGSAYRGWTSRFEILPAERNGGSRSPGASEGLGGFAERNFAHRRIFLRGPVSRAPRAERAHGRP